MIEITNLQKTFEDSDLTVLKDISLKIEHGDIYGLVGRSGAGKSTLLRCINGLTGYQGGSLKVDGCEVKELSGLRLREFRKNIGMIFQQFSLLERKTVYDNVALPMECWGWPKQKRDQKVKELLELVGLKEKLYVKPRTLSGGQKQRVAIARALTMDPKILLCDEATSALDPKTTNSILDLLLKINKELKITIVIVTHQMSVVRRVCNKMSILENGKLAEQGDVRQIFLNQPAALMRLMGEEGRELPKTGCTLQISYDIRDEKDGELFTAMSEELHIRFSVIDGKIQKYRGSMMGLFVINVSDGNADNVKQYLDKKGYQWKELETEKGGESWD